MWEVAIRTDKSEESTSHAKCALWEGDQDNGIIQIIQMTLIAVHIVLALVNGHKADILVRFADKLSELRNLLSDSGGENHAVCFERTNGIEPLEKKGIMTFTQLYHQSHRKKAGVGAGGSSAAISHTIWIFEREWFSVRSASS